MYKGYRRDLRDLHTINRKVEISMLEREIEKALVDKIKIHGGLCLKFTSPSMTGIPDRIILLPKGKIGFVETKRPGGEPRPIQKKRIRQFKNLGFKVYVLDTKENIDEIIRKIGGD
ncbi:MAG: VRR-NUC domain-containing protein [Peptoniphilaceae bacterium]